MERKERKKETLFFILATVLVILADQALKLWVHATIPLNASDGETLRFIPGLVRLNHIHNSGVAFGMLQGGRWAFLALLAAFCAVVIWALHTDKLTAGWERWLAVLALAGALSNGIDRAVNGYVEDMLELQFMHFAIFNLADFVINVSCIAFMILTLFGKSPERKKEDNTKTEL